MNLKINTLETEKVPGYSTIDSRMEEIYSDFSRLETIMFLNAEISKKGLSGHWQRADLKNMASQIQFEKCATGTLKAILIENMESVKMEAEQLAGNEKEKGQKILEELKMLRQKLLTQK